MIQYTEYTSPSGDVYILRVNEDGTESHIPSDIGNSDYQTYLHWVADPNQEDTILPTE